MRLGLRWHSLEVDVDLNLVPLSYNVRSLWVRR